MTTHAAGSKPEKLELSPGQMRTLGYQVIDMLVEHYTSIDAKPAKQAIDRGVLEAILKEPLPEQGADVMQLVKQLQEEIFVDVEHKIHPRDFAFIPGPSNFVSVMADTLAGGYNIFSGAQVTSSGATIIESQVIDWLCGAFGFSDAAGGLFVSGGSVANLTGLAVARRIKLADTITGARIYYSEQTHVSNTKALKLLGFQADQLCAIQSDADFRIDMVELRQQLDTDRSAGRRPFCVIANAGTTNTGAVDPLQDLAALCEKEDMWLHVDGAFGAAAALCEESGSLLDGLHRADSLSFDPHKWLFQPYEIGGVIVRDLQHLPRTFATQAEYLRDIQVEGADFNYFDYGIQMTRSFRALKMWLSIKTFGMHAFRRAIARGIALAELAESILRKSGKWEIVTPAQLGILTFRYLIDGANENRLARINQHIIEEMQKDGYAFLLTTSLRGKTVIRLCSINPRTSDDDIRQTISRLEAFGDAGLREIV